MIAIIEFILFILYTILIFFLKEYYLLAIIAGVNLLLMIILRVNIKNAVFAIVKLLPVIIFTTLINIWISGISFGLLVGIRLILVCNITYIFSKKTTFSKLQYVIETILKPLKIINIDSKEIGTMLCIGIAFIPIIQREIEGIKFSLKAKGFNLNAKNLISKPNYVLAPLITGIIKRVGEIEYSLSSKGYVSE